MVCTDNRSVLRASKLYTSKVGDSVTMACSNGRYMVNRVDRGETYIGYMCQTITALIV